MRDEADASRGSRSRATTKSSEDYLEAILVIRRLRGSCRNVDIAERLGFSKASVTKALGNLARKGLVEVVDHDVRLTAAGKHLAEETLSKHRESTPIPLTPFTPPSGGLRLWASWPLRTRRG